MIFSILQRRVTLGPSVVQIRAGDTSPESIQQPLREGRPYVLQLVKKRVLFKIDKQMRAQDKALLKKVNSLDFE